MATTISLGGLTISLDQFNAIIKHDGDMGEQALKNAVAAVTMDEKTKNLLSMFSNIKEVALTHTAGGVNTQVVKGDVTKDNLAVAGIDGAGFTFTYEGKPVTIIEYNPANAGGGRSRVRRPRRRRKNKSSKKHSS